MVVLHRSPHRRLVAAFPHRSGLGPLAALVLLTSVFQAQAGETSFRIASIGDYGEDGPDELAVAELVDSWGPDAVFTVGDNSYGLTPIDDNVGKYYSDYIGDYVGAYGPGSLTNRFFPSLGNHDYSDGGGIVAYLDYFTLPGTGVASSSTSGNERYYDFVYGPVHFFAINSNVEEPDGYDSTSVQASWLEGQLALSASPWKIVYFHHSPYASGGGSSRMAWPFDRWGATAVVSGHDHHYERLQVNGVPYFVNGLGGRSIRSLPPTPADSSAVRYDGNFGAMLIKAHSLGITFEFHSISNGDSLIDSYTIGELPPPEPDLVIAPSSRDYGAIPLEEVSTQPFQVQNAGTSDLVVSATTIEGLDPLEFTIKSGAAPFTLAPGDSSTLLVSFHPATRGTKSATLRITSNDARKSPLDVPLSGAGIDVPVNGGSVLFEESVSGASSASPTVTSAVITGVTGDVYLAAVASKGYRPTTGVTGLGLSWMLVRAQCSGRHQTGVDVWLGTGLPTTGAVTATFSEAPNNGVIAVARYSSVNLVTPLGVVGSWNTNGAAGVCDGGTDGTFYSETMTMTAPGSMGIGFVAMRTKTHTPSAGWTVREESRQGSGGDGASVALMDQEIAAAGPVLLEGAFNSTVDWAVVGMELLPNGDFPDIAASPGSYDFGPVEVDSTGSTDFMLRNKGTIDLEVTSTTIVGLDATEFSITAGGGPIVLSPNDSTLVGVSFTPASSGAKSASVRVISDDPDESPLDIPLTGAGVHPVPDVHVDPTSHDFGEVIVGLGAQQTFVVRNEGFADLNLSSISIVGGDSSVFAVTSGPYPSTLVPGDSTAVEVSFTPTSTGAKSSTLRVTSDDPDEDPFDVPLTGSGLATPEPDIALSPLSHDYGGVVVGSTVATTIIVRNEGTAILQVMSTSLTGTDAGEFSIESGAAPFDLAPGDTASVVVRFVPTSAGTKSATLLITSDDPDESSGVVALSGNGVDAPVGGGDVTFEESTAGGSSSSLTVTSGTITAVPGHIYLAAVASKKYQPTTSVSGLNLTWTPLRAQCGGRLQTGIDVWIGTGAPVTGAVQATFSRAPNNGVITVSRYSGVDLAIPVGTVSSWNTLGPDGACNGGTDGLSYAETMTTIGVGSMAVGFVAMRTQTHTPDPAWNVREESRQGGGGAGASLALMDQSVANPGPVLYSGTFDAAVDWVVVGMELRAGGDSPDIAAVPGSHDYGVVEVAMTDSAAFTVHNVGTADLNVTSATIVGSHAEEFSIATGGGPFALPSGDSASVVVHFAPTSSGAKSASVRIASDDPDENPLDLPLSGTGFAPGPDIAVAPASHDFGPIEVGLSAQALFAIRNEGTLSLEVASISVVGEDADLFAITGGGGPFALAPGDSAAIEVTFTPTVPGPGNATFRVSSNDPDENPWDAPLSGSGVDPGGGGVVLEETAVGGSSRSLDVTSGPLTGVSGQVYLAAVASKDYLPTTSVQGLGLAWTQVRAQCAGGSQTGVDVWVGTGSATSGSVTATFADAPRNAVIVASRYSGADLSGPVGASSSWNANGTAGICEGGTESAAYSEILTGVGSGSLVVGAVAMRHKSHTPGPAWTVRTEPRQGNGGQMASLAFMEHAVSPPSSVLLEGTFGSSVDWALVAVEIRPSAPLAGPPSTLQAEAPLAPIREAALEITSRVVRGSVTLELMIPAQEHVRISLYNVRGQRVATIRDEVLPAGRARIEWSDGRSSPRLTAGVYFVQAIVGSRAMTERVVLLR